MRLEERFFAGWIIGIVAVTYTSLFAARFSTFSLGSTMQGCAISVAAGFAIWVKHLKQSRSEYDDFVKRIRNWKTLDSPATLLILLIPFWYFIANLFAHAYVTLPDGSIQVGHLAPFSDWQAHLIYTSSFAYADNTSLQLPLASGYKLNYHAGINAFSALLATGGISIPGSLQLGGAFALFAFPGVMYTIGMRVFKSPAVSLLGTFLFLCLGGLGWTVAFSDIKELGMSMFSSLPRTYTRMPTPDEGSYVFENPIVGHFYPQRPTLIGLPMTLIILGWMSSAFNKMLDEDKDMSRTFLFCGVIVGFMPFFNLFGFGAPIAFVGIWWLLSRLRTQLLWFLVPAALLALPMVIYMRPPSSSLVFPYDWATRIMLQGAVPENYPITSRINNFIVFWGRNLGVFIPLLIAATAIPGILSKRLRIGLAPLWLFFIVPNAVKPHPWDGNNTHYFIFVALLGSLPVAALLVESVRRISLSAIVVVLVTLSMTMAGMLDIFATNGRVASPYPVTALDHPGVTLSKWARTTPTDSVFMIEGAWVTGSNLHQHPLASLSGRTVVESFHGWIFDLGVPDVGQRSADAKAVFEAVEGHEDLIDKYGVDYLVVGPPHRSPNWDPNYGYWNENAEIVFEYGGWIVYEL